MKNNNTKRTILFLIGLMLAVCLALAFEYFTNDARNIPQGKRERITIDSMVFNYDYEKVLRIYTEYDNKCEVYVDGVSKYVDSEARIIKDNKNDKGINISSYSINDTGKEISIINPDENTQIIKIELDNRYIFNYRYFTYALMLALLGLFSLYYIIIDERKPEKIFLTLGLIIVVTMSITLPITTVDSWDEHLHYSHVREEIPAELDEVDYLLGNQDLSWIYDTVAQDEIINNAESSDQGVKGFTEAVVGEVSNPIIHFYNFIAYYPAAVIISLAKLMGTSNSLAYILGRLTDGLLYVVICYFAIRRLKSSKILASCIALIPMALFQSSVYTYDWWVTAFLFLGCAYLLAELQEPERQMQHRDYILTIGAVVVGCGPKAIYFPIILLLLLLPNTKYYSKRQHRMGNIIILAACLLVLSSFLLPFIIGGPGTGDARGGSDVNATEQVAFILSNPIKYTRILLKAIAGYIMPNGIAYSLAELGYIAQSKANILLPLGCVILVDILLATFCDRNECDRVLLKAKNRGWIYLCIFAIICLIETALYVTYNPVAAETIAGVQRRYLLPIFLLAFTMLGSKRLINTVKKIPNRVGIFAIAIPAGISILELGYLSVINYF